MSAVRNAQRGGGNILPTMGIAKNAQMNLGENDMFV